VQPPIKHSLGAQELILGQGAPVQPADEALIGCGLRETTLLQHCPLALAAPVLGAAQPHVALELRLPGLQERALVVLQGLEVELCRGDRYEAKQDDGREKLHLCGNCSRTASQTAVLE